MEKEEKGEKMGEEREKETMKKKKLNLMEKDECEKKKERKRNKAILISLLKIWADYIKS